MRIVLSPAAVYATRLTTALACGGVLLWGLGGDFRADPWLLGVAVGLFGLTAFLTLPDFLARRKRWEPGVVDLRTILGSADFWGPVATIVFLTLLIHFGGWAGRPFLAITFSALLSGWAHIGRRAFWVDAPSVLRWPVRDERDLVEP